MITQEKALKTLSRFNIDEDQLESWESELNLDIPVDKFGNKIYSQLHINLFKNIKKHLTLGRSLLDIKRMVILPRQEATQENDSSKNDSASDQPVETESKALASVGSSAANKTDGSASPFALALEATQVFAQEPTTIPESVITTLQEPVAPATVLSTPSETRSSEQPVLLATAPNSLSQRLLRELKPVEPKRLSLQEFVDAHETQGIGEPLMGSSLVSRKSSRFSTPPVRINTASMQPTQGQNAGLLALIDKLMAEKDTLQQKLLLAEKQKAHLMKANDIFQQKVNDLNAEIEHLKEIFQSKEHFQEHLKLIDDKSRLQKQVLDVEERHTRAEKKLMQLNSEVERLRSSLSDRIDPKVFVGNWLEEADLVEVVFDNFGINIESKRNRMFKITHPPERCFGHTAVVETTYDYQTNTLWKRTETLVLSIIHENRLEGELIVEYQLDGTPVARANYKARCYRNGIKGN